MKFSVIIPTYNRAHTLTKCLQSLVDQTFKDFEVIIVDDASKDQTSTIVEEFKTKLDLKYIQNDKPSGGAHLPRNIGAKHAQGEWLSFLDSDDFWYENKLEEVLKHTQKYDVIYHNLDTYNAQGKLKKAQVARQVHNPVFIDLMVKHNALITSATSIKKSIFDKVGGFEIIDLEDYDLWLRVAKITDQFFYLNKILGGYYQGGDNTTQVSEKEISRLENIFRKHSPNLLPKDQTDAACALSYIKGRIYKKMGDKVKAKQCFKESSKSSIAIIKTKSFINLLLV